MFQRLHGDFFLTAVVLAIVLGLWRGQSDEAIEIPVVDLLTERNIELLDRSRNHNHPVVICRGLQFFIRKYNKSHV